ncbi:rab3 GTPase-activating protein non-catalytic subunit-like [Uloborus diversus]|uniref:rab3 GTPase-activating protein non-catalytic subunit-like n=1 Tax=Uloborus diversus TaxID=327109 RepID=UPI0024095B1B|nr:rab3 GTPase-activating protein non-catalytic subunit-like [Uloborus diversus]
MLLQGSSQLLLTDVVHAVASKLMNFISHYNTGGLGGFMGFNQPKEQKPQPKIEPATILPLRFGLYDKRRQGISMSLSPNKCLAAITDAFGRVILFDIFKGVAVRMWKGYRDAQCGWVEVEDAIVKDAKHDREKKRRVFFLVIYAPRRGILEVWCTQQGPRVAAFNVGKTGRLYCPGYAMVGGSVLSSNLAKDHLCSCYFLDVDGVMKKIIVPFHLVLSEKNSRRARDLHLLRELKLTLKNVTKGKSFEIIKILHDMRTSCTRIQALENILSSRYSTVELVEEVALSLLGHLRKQDPLHIDHEAKLLQQSCVRTLQLLKLYNAVSRINTKPEATSPGDPMIDVQAYSTSLCISETEVGRILSLVTLHQTVVPVLKRQVRFTDDNATEMSFPDFVTCFVVNDSHLIKSGEEIVLQNLSVDLSGNISGKQVEQLGGFLFHSSIHVGSCFSTLQVALKESGVIPEKLLLLLLKHWVSDAGFCSTADKWINLQQVMKHISTLSDPKLVSSDAEHVSPWWSSVRETLHKATGNVAAYIGAVVARSVSVIMANSFSVEHKKTGNGKKNNGEKEHDESGDSDWESVSLDLEHWNLLVKQLEDVLMLNILLKSQPYGKAVVKDVNISIETILNGGQGSVTDLVAVWAVSVGLEPEVLSSFISVSSSEEVPSLQKFLEDKSESRSLNIVKGLLSEVRRKFPHSLNHDALLANYCWEHMMQWSKNKETVVHLEKSLSALNLVKSSVIKNGFASMMWKTCILKTFEALALLMDKVGKTPKERLCRKDLEMSDAHLENFLQFCCQLLNIIFETNIPSEVEEVPIFPVEAIWQGHENAGRTPLITMALSQKATNNRQVYVHLMLATVLHFIIVFQMKSVKPLSLFSILTKKALFRDLHHTIQELTEKDDQSLRASRIQFLLRAATAVAQTLPETLPDCVAVENNNCVDSTNQMDYCVASKRFNDILDLARGWELELDDIRRHYVCELYSGGQDLLAQEILSAVTDKEHLASQLLLLAGQRIHKIIFDSSDPTSKLGCLTPDVTAFLKKLGDTTLRCNNVPLDLTLVLLDQVLVYMPENSREQKLAIAMKQALLTLVHKDVKCS